MKNIGFLLLALIVVPFLSRSQNECIDPDFEDNCTGLLYSVFDDYVYLRSRAFTSTENIDVTFTVTLKRNVLYILNVCEGAGRNSMILELYDSNNKLVSSSFNKQTKKNTKIIAFRPEVAGKYYLSTFFEKKVTKCCIIMFGMIKKNIEQYISKTH